MLYTGLCVGIKQKLLGKKFYEKGFNVYLSFLKEPHSTKYLNYRYFENIPNIKLDHQMGQIK